MSYIKNEILNAVNTEPISFIKVAAHGLDAYFEYYSLLEYKNLCTFIKNFNSSPFIEITGASGCGKSSFKEIIKNFFDENICVFSYNCSEITELDDIFYTFYKFTLKYPIRKELFRNGSSSFKPSSLDEQILHYLKNISPNIVMIFDNFEKLFDEEGKIKAANIRSFFEYISTLKNIKVVFMSGTSIKDALTVYGDTISSISLNGLNEGQIKDFLAIFKTEAPQSLHKEIFTKTNGYIYSLKLLVTASKALNLPISAILKDCDAQKEKLDDFIIKKFLNKLYPETKKALCYFTLFRHEISPDVVNSIERFSNLTEDITTLKNYMLLEGNENCEVRQFIKNIVYDSVSAKEKAVLHEKIADFYANQIPLKPSERILEISRTSMYAEKFYHYNVGSKWSKSLSLQTTKDAYSQPSQEIRPDAQTIKYIASTQYLPDFDNKDKTTSNLKFDIPNTDNLSDEEQDMLNMEALHKPMKDILSLENKNTNNALSGFNTKYTDNMDELNKIEDHDLMKAHELLEKGISLYNEGNAYESISYLKDAIEKLEDKNGDNIHIAKLTLARALAENYKYKDAITVLFDLLESDIHVDMRIDTLLELASCYDAQERHQDALEVYNKALKLSKDENNKALCAKTYFKMGLYFDERNNTEKALYHYLLSATDAAELTDKSMLASIYSNIASIYEDKEETQKAIDFYKKSIKADEYSKNYDGQTKSYSALGNIFLKKEEINVALQLFIKATQTAKLTEDNYTIASSYLELGDAFLQKKDYKNALKAYLLSKKNIDNTISTDSKNKIERRFELIVNEIGENAYKYMLQELRTK